MSGLIMKSHLENMIVRETGATDRDSLDEYTVYKIKETIDYAKAKSRFYKDRLKEINTDKINTLKDFTSVPFTYPKELAERANDFLCVPQKYVSRIVTLKTSGTTAADGKRIFFTDKDLNLTVNFFCEGFKAMLNKGDRVMIMMPGETYGSAGDIIKKSLGLLNVKSFIYGVLKDCDDAGRFIEVNKINSIIALPMHAVYLSKIKEDIFKNSIEKLMLSADYVPEAIIKRFKKKYNIKVFTHYGLTETGYGCGVECECLTGYHIRENDVYLEITDPATGQAFPDGNMGEIVITAFNREAMPLIRYRTGDYGSYKSKRCECSTFLKTLERSKGRIANKILINNRYMHMSELDEFFFRYDSILDYSIAPSDNGIDVKIFLLYECPDLSEEIKEKMYEKFNAKINLTTGKKEDVILVSNTMMKRTICPKP